MQGWAGAGEPVLGGELMEDPRIFVGIDVSGAHLDVVSRPMSEMWQVPNDAEGISRSGPAADGYEPFPGGLEAWGGLEWALTARLAAARLSSGGGQS